ncbi:MAG: ABC transporter ATP-binding protein [Gaiellales bacterium]
MHAPTQTSAAPPAVAVRDLTKVYDGGTLALDRLDLEIPAGSFFGLLGPNGAGKSTFIRALCGLVRISDPRSSIKVFGIDTRTDSVAARRHIGLSPQDFNLDRFLTVRETLTYHGGYFGMTRREAREKATELIDAFDLSSKAHTRTPRLSGGMKRRLLLARAFMHDPPLLVLDEPTAGVDVELRMELHEYIRQLHKSGRTILLTTHYLEEAEALCDDIALIHHGRVVMRGTPTDLKSEHGAGSVEELYMQVVGR